MTDLPGDDDCHIAPLAARQWRYVGRAPGLAEKLSALGSALEAVLEAARKPSPGAPQALSEIGRQQLITLAQTTRTMATSPMIEHGLLQVMNRVLERTVRKTSEAGAEEALGTTARTAHGALEAVIEGIWPDI